MSRLTGLAQAISGYLRRRIQGTAGGHLPPIDPRSFTDLRSGAPPIDPRASRDLRPGAPPIDPRMARDRRTGAPPIIRPSLPGMPPSSRSAQPEAIQPPRIPPTGHAPTGDEFDDIQLLGRDASYDKPEWEEMKSSMRLVESSNVYSYGYQHESPTMGILYVTFLNWVPRSFGGDGSRSGPGPTYGYYDFPVAKFKAFEAMAASSAGGAVWDFCRVRHSVFEHQHTYRLIQSGGDYVPRKATAKGFKARMPANIGVGPRNLKGQLARQQLPPRNYAALPKRALPNRGTPKNGR